MRGHPRDFRASVTGFNYAAGADAECLGPHALANTPLPESPRPRGASSPSPVPAYTMARSSNATGARLVVAAALVVGAASRQAYLATPRVLNLTTYLSVRFVLRARASRARVRLKAKPALDSHAHGSRIHLRRPRSRRSLLHCRKSTTRTSSSATGTRSTSSVRESATALQRRVCPPRWPGRGGTPAVVCTTADGAHVRTLAVAQGTHTAFRGTAF